MQFLKVPHDLITDTQVSSNEFRVYAYIMSRYNTEKQCSYPSIDVIAEKVGLSTRTVVTCIKNLAKLEYLKVTKKKGINGNYNEYSDIKYLVPDKEENKVQENKVPNEVPAVPKEIIISDCKESGLQLPLAEDNEVPELSPYTKLHQQKISLVLKLGVKLSEKQKDIIGDMDLETLREAIRSFKKKKGRTFTFLMELYLDEASKNDIEISEDIRRYTGCLILTEAEKETQKALRELELHGPYGLCG